VAALGAAHCLQAQGPGSPSIFRNTDPSVAYVGSNACTVAGCHEEIGRAYATSPHGLSMVPANTPTDLARVPKPVTVFNSKNNHTYIVYQQNGELYQQVYELDKNGRRLYSATHKIGYAVGGERTGYSYLFRIDNWIFQAPLSYYAPSKTWELSPGYIADDVGFTRVMTTGCLVCHNGQPDPKPRRDGMYNDPPFRFDELGIGCEACHGPGALHVREMQTKNNRVLAANEVDTSIVNPAKLSPRLADDICRECHQAGDAVVLNPGKTDIDFRPGAPLSDTMNIVRRPLTLKERAEANRLETEPPVRGSLEQPLWWKNSTLELSRCYTASHGRLTCSTCHSTHHAPQPGEERTAYRAACLTCHTVTSCTLKPEDSKRVAAHDYCIECHMEKRPVAGIAHSNDTKHRIVRYPGQPLPEIAFEQPKPDLPGLLWLNRPAGNSEFPEHSQLEAYWTAARKNPNLWPIWFQKLTEMSESSPNDPLVLSYLGAIALAERKDNATAAVDFARALQLGAEAPQIFLNLAAALDGLGRTKESEVVLERGNTAYPYNGAIVATLAAHYAANGRAWLARSLVDRYFRAFPEDKQVRDALSRIDTADRSGVPVSTGTGHR
jgi:hypothetical protein